MRMSVIAVAAGLAISANPATAAPFISDCTITVEDPHFSDVTRANGVVAKARIQCRHVKTAHYTVKLWLCRDRPHVTNGGIWFCRDSTLKGEDSDVITNPKDGKTITRVAPKLGEPGARGSGYWVANAFINHEGKDGWSTGSVGLGEHSKHAPHITTH